MDKEEVITPQEVNQAADVAVAEQVVESMQEDGAEMAQESSQEREEKQVPLSALQKERKKRQDLELQIEWERQQRQQSYQPQQPQEEDLSRYESATKEDLNRVQHEAIRVVEEKMWVRSNPEKYERLNEQLPEFLKQRPHLAQAINASPNRYEEAYLLMDALSPREQKQLKVATQAAPKREAPNAPTSIPKAAGINQTVDVMQMSDDEFRAWRSSKKRAR